MAWKIVKVKFALEHVMKAQTGSRCIALLFLRLGTLWGGWQRYSSAVLPPLKRPGTHCTGGWVQKILSPPEFDSRTVQPVGSRYTTALSLPTFMAWIVGEILIVASVWSSVCRVSQHLGSVLQNVTRGVLLGRIGSGYIGNNCWSAGEVRRRGCSLRSAGEVRRRGCSLRCSCSEFVCSVTCISLRGLRRTRHCCWMLAVLHCTTNPPIDVFSRFVTSTWEKRAPFRAERRVHRNVEEEDTVLPCYSANCAQLDANSFRAPHVPRMRVWRTLHAEGLRHIIRDAQISACLSVCKPPFSCTISFLSQTDHCSRRLF